MFVKEPRPGLVKTRLAQDTSPAWAAGVADAFLRDMLDRLVGLNVERFLVFAPPDARGWFVPLALGRYQLMSQGDGDLGQRLQRFIQSRLESGAGQVGAGQVVVVGADSPTLPIAYVERAFSELANADVVLGPASDGGYYLIGLANADRTALRYGLVEPTRTGSPIVPIFHGIDWGSAKVLSQTISRLVNPSRTSHPWRLALLPPWYDVDTLADWRFLQGHVAAMRRAGLDPGIPHTERLFSLQRGLFRRVGQH